MVLVASGGEEENYGPEDWVASMTNGVDGRTER